MTEMPSAAPPQADVAGPPRTELEELQIKANQVTDDVSHFRFIQKQLSHSLTLLLTIFSCIFLSYIFSILLINSKKKFLKYLFDSSPWRVHDECWPFARR